MKNQANTHYRVATLVLLALPFAAGAQVPVDDDGNVVGDYETAPEAQVSDRATGNEDIPLLSATELEELVGPIALYPDDLLAIVLPAAAYPMQLIEAQRFLQDLENDPSLEPSPDWDDSVVALLNYPEVVELLNDDIDWTWRLGEAVVAQQSDVVGAIEVFRDRAYAAGNLKSDEYQTVSRDEGVIEITPVSDDVIYVPYYEPERVVVYQPRPVYYYYPRAYPVYYYPYASSYHFDRGYFWGVTTAFTIGWLSDSLHVYHHSYYGHPYYGRSYWDRWWYRRPSINVYNTTYVRNSRVTINHYYSGDRWTPRLDRRRPARPTEPRVMSRDHYARDRNTGLRRSRSVESSKPIRFRDRSSDGMRSANRGRVQPADRARVQPADRARVQPADRGQARPSRESIARELRQSRDRTAQRDNGGRQQPVGRSSRERQEPVARSRNERQDRVLRSRSERSVPNVRQGTERREPVARQERQARSGSAERRTQRPATTTRVERPAAAARNSRPSPQVQSQRTARAEPQREARREARPAPRREVRQEPRRTEKAAERSQRNRSSSQESAPEPRKRSKERRAER